MLPGAPSSLPRWRRKTGAGWGRLRADPATKNAGARSRASSQKTASMLAQGRARTKSKIIMQKKLKFNLPSFLRCSGTLLRLVWSSFPQDLHISSPPGLHFVASTSRLSTGKKHIMLAEGRDRTQNKISMQRKLKLNLPSFLRCQNNAI